MTGGRVWAQKKSLHHWGFHLWVLGHEPQGWGERSEPLYCLFVIHPSRRLQGVLEKNRTLETFIFPHRQKKDVKHNLIDYSRDLLSGDDECKALVEHLPNWHVTDTAGSTNTFTPRRGRRKLLCAACNGKSLFIQLITLRDRASYRCSLFEVFVCF